MPRLSAVLTSLHLRGTFARGVGTLIGGTASAQILTMLAAPIVMRLFTPEDFGILAVYAGLLGIITTFAGMCYEIAIPLPQSHQEAAHIAALALSSVVIISGVSLGVVTWGGASIAELLGVPALARYFWLLPIGILAAGTYQIFNFWALRTKSFGAISVTRLKQSLASIAIQLAGHSFGPVALLIAQVANQGMGVMSLGRATLQFQEFRQVRLSGLLLAARRYRHFPFFSTWSGLLNSGGMQLPSLLFAAIFGPQAAGLYVLTSRVLSVPVTIVGSAIGTYLFATGAEARREGEIARLMAAVHDKLANIALPPALTLLLAGPDLFALIFGESWRQAGEFARWLAPWLYIGFVTSPLNVLFDVLERQRLELFFEILLFALRIAAILVGAWIGDVIVTVGLFSLAGVTARIATLIWLSIVCGNPIAILVPPTLTALFWAIACNIPLAVTLYLHTMPAAWLMGLSLTTILVAARTWRAFTRADK